MSNTNYFAMIDDDNEFEMWQGLRGPAGPAGADGKSAYQAAIEGGFSGTEAEFNDYLSGIGDLTDEVSQQKSAIEDLQDLTNRKAGALVDTASGAIASFVPDATVPDLLGLTVDIEPVQAGSGDPSPDNVRPISGWSAIGIDAAGVNLLSNAVNSITTSGVTFTVNADRSVSVATDGPATGRANLFYQGELHLPRGSYYLSIGKAFAAGQCYFELAIYKAATGTTQYINTNGVAGKAFSLENGDYIRQMYFSVFAGKEVNDTIYPQIETGSTASSYHPFAGNTYTIQLGQTVYGGTLDAVNGTMTVDRGFLSFNGSSSNGWSYQTTYGSVSRFNYNNNDIKPSGAIASNYLPVGAIGTQNLECINTHGSQRQCMIQISTSRLSSNDVSGLMSYFSAHPLQICFDLATPIEITLDPVTISTIAGQINNVWADAGDVSAEYAADIKAYIDRLNQPTEEDMVANNLIASGKYFTVNNRLFLSTASIAAGAQIIPGTNCTETSLVEALNALNA